MVDIPAKIVVPVCIESGSVYHYDFSADRKDGTTYKGSRFFIVVNINPKTDEVIVLVTVTTKIDKQMEYIKVIGADPDTIVKITPKDFEFLSKESIVNCNNHHVMTMDQLVAKIDNGGKVFHEKLPTDILNRIKAGILKSNQIPPDIKKLVI